METRTNAEVSTARPTTQVAPSKSTWRVEPEPGSVPLPGRLVKELDDALLAAVVRRLVEQGARKALFDDGMVGEISIDWAVASGGEGSSVTVTPPSKPKKKRARR